MLAGGSMRRAFSGGNLHGLIGSTDGNTKYSVTSAAPGRSTGPVSPSAQPRGSLSRQSSAPLLLPTHPPACTFDVGTGATGPTLQGRSPASIYQTAIAVNHLAAARTTPAVACPAARRRVSYVISRGASASPAHQLGINALAVDRGPPGDFDLGKDQDDDIVLSTWRCEEDARHDIHTVPDTSSTGGLLYTAGRDGMIACWDLHLPMLRSAKWRQRVGAFSQFHGGDPDREKQETVLGSGSAWYVDPNKLTNAKPPKTTFLYSLNHHNDWVNDIVLCHDGQTLISASSDKTVHLWRPRVAYQRRPASADDTYATAGPFHLGSHTDYVKCLALPSAGGNWVASGAFDRTICLWDMNRCGSHNPNPIVRIEETSSRCSIYALACNSVGSILASGSPEKVVRVWDPRNGGCIAKFTGHADNVRALLVSYDGDLILSASSDSTMKLWSLRAHRCITTFTYHPDSVWSLASESPGLDIFYAGGKDGLVTRTNVLGSGGGTDGECVAICREKFGVAKIALLDNEYIWTATSSSDVQRWRDVAAPLLRSPTSSPPFTSLPEASAGAVIGTPPVDPSFFYSSSGHSSRRGSQMSAKIPDGFLAKFPPRINGRPSMMCAPLSPRDYGIRPVAFSGANGEVLDGIPSADGGETEMTEEAEVFAEDVTCLRQESDETVKGEAGLTKHALLNNRRQVLTLDRAGEVTLWDIIRCKPMRSYGKQSLEEIAEELTTTECVANWCCVDTRIGALTVTLDERCFDAEAYYDEVVPPEEVSPNVNRDQRVNYGKWVLRFLFYHYAKKRLEQEAKEAEERLTEDSTAYSSPVVNRNTQSTEHTTPARMPPGFLDNFPKYGLHPCDPLPINGTISVSTGTPTVPQTAEGTEAAQSYGGHADCSHSSPVSRGLYHPIGTTPILYPPPVAAGGPLSSMSSSTTGEYFSSTALVDFQHQFRHDARTLSGPTAPTTHEPQHSVPSASGSRTPYPVHGTDASLLQPPPAAASPSGTDKVFMRKLRNLSVKGPPQVRSQFAVATSTAKEASPACVPRRPSSASTPPTGPPGPMQDAGSDSFLADIFSNPETPFIDIPESTGLCLSEEVPECSKGVDVWRGTVGSLRDSAVARRMESAAPVWLLAYLLEDKIAAREVVKLSFVLKPDDSPGTLPLADLPSGQNRLTANRMLRIRKVIAYVVEKLELVAPSGRNSTVAGGSDSTDGGAGNETIASPISPSSPPLLPEEWIELLCNGQVLPPTATLATVRTHVWKQGGDLQMRYRLRLRPAAGQKQLKRQQTLQT